MKKDIKKSIILLIGLLTVFVALLLDNNYLTENSYLVFVFYTIIAVSDILSRTQYVKEIFYPSIVMLLFYGLSLSLGSFLVPRGYGFATVVYYDSVLSIDSFNIIVSYLIISLMCLYYLSVKVLESSSRNHTVFGVQQNISRGGNIKMIFGVIGLMFFSLSDFILSTGFQLAFAVVLMFAAMKRGNSILIVASLFVLGMFSIFNYENKREILMALMLVVFIFSCKYDWKFNLKIKNLATYIFVVILFFCLIIVASIMRGYGGFGDFNNLSVLDAIGLIPSYIVNEGFIDSIVDNLELHHTFSAASLVVEYYWNGQLEYLLGESIIKPLFIPIPREMFILKPESVMTVFTRYYLPLAYEAGGSLPVILPAEMFANFGVFGAIALYFIVNGANKIARSIYSSSVSEFWRVFAIGATVFSFIYIRGGGLDLYTLTLLPCAVVFYLSTLSLRNK